MKRKFAILIVGVLLISTLSCGHQKQTTDGAPKPTIQAPAFDADSAYRYVQAQVDFGARTPNSKEHVACGNYLAAQLTTFGAQVTNQYADLIAYDGTLLKARNIIGSYKPESKKRIALFAHWDTRPWADNDPDEQNHHTPVLGANDGASGVGVLLEVARLLQQQEPALGIDLIFLDAEDSGTPRFHTGEYNEESWCLGAQHWAKSPHVANYNARFGILLDMVGGKNATFYREEYSEKYAKDINKRFFQKANELGFGRYFINERGAGGITDDHLFINRIAKIPTIDIVPYHPNATNSSFGETWHTVHDNMENIDRNTLKAVGQTVVEIIYNEQ